MLKWKTLLFFFGLGLLFSVLAFYNGYPLITSDTGAYINNGYDLKIPNDRLLTYSLFLRHFSLQYTLWLPIWIQGWLLTWLLYRLVRTFMPDQEISRFHFTIIVLVLAGFTAGAWYSGQLMPDIFTAFLAIAIILFFLDPWRPGRWIYPLLILIFTLMHHSHLLILLGMALFLLLFTFFRKTISIQKATTLSGLSFGALLLVALLNVSAGKGFVLSTSTHVFLMGKLCENGMLKVYLDQHCQKKSYSLCTYKDQLPQVAWDFIWDPNSPFYQTGGWDSTRTEYNEILKGVFFSPRYWPSLLFKSAEHTLRQLSQIQIGDGLYPYRENTNPYWKVQQYYGHELPEYMRSRQQMATLDVKPFNIVYILTFLLSSLAMLVLAIKNPFSQKVKWIYLFLILFIMINAFVTANFANVLGRLSSRVNWLIPAVNLILLFRHFLFSKK